MPTSTEINDLDQALHTVQLLCYCEKANLCSLLDIASLMLLFNSKFVFKTLIMHLMLQSFIVLQLELREKTHNTAKQF